MRAFLTALVVSLALVLAPARPAMAQYDPGWFSAWVTPFLLTLETVVIDLIEQISTAVLQATMQAASVQNSLQQEKILATVVEVAKGKEVASAQAQLQQDAARIRELTRLPPMACQTLDGVKVEAAADDGAKTALNEIGASMRKHSLETTNSAVIASNLLSTIDRVKKDAQPSMVNFLRPKVYSNLEDEAAQVLMKTVIDPMPVEALPKAWTATPQGRAFEMQRLLYQQKLSAASYGLENAYSVRRAVPEGVKSAGAQAR